VELLLAANADVDSKDCLGRTALSFAAEKGDLEVVKKLLAANGDVNSNNWA
jgi:ankyrin repeat protein